VYARGLAFPDEDEVVELVVKETKNASERLSRNGYDGMRSTAYRTATVARYLRDGTRAHDYVEKSYAVAAETRWER
jgi:hypothetical protein